MFDLNDAQPQMGPLGDLIPDGSFAQIRMTIRPGGVDGTTPIDAGLLRASRTSDARMLDCEFTVTEGPFARRKFWQNFTVAGGKLDERGQSKAWNISKSTFRAMVDSALGLDPCDESPAAREKRMLQGLKQLDGITFAARIMVEPASSAQYRDANKLANVVLPGDPHYDAIMKGVGVPPEPINARPRKGPETSTVQAPAWSTPGPSGPGLAGSGTPWSGQGSMTSGPASSTPPTTNQPAPAQAPAAPVPSSGPAWLNG